MSLQFTYSEIYHYNFISPSFVPFSTVVAYKGLLSVTYPYMKAYGHYVPVFFVRPSAPVEDKHSPTAICA